MREAGEFTLPWPPSINHYYGERRRVKCAVCRQFNKVPPRFLTKKAKEFRRNVELMLYDEPGFRDAKLAMRIDWYPPRNVGDIDNNLKPLLDALEHAKMFDNDRQIKDIRIVWQHPYPDGKAIVKIWSI